ncbi:MAG: flagellin [Pirellulales bacterium]
MTRINTNVGSLVAQTRLSRTNNDLQTSLTRLSTGLRINTGKDDPAGLIASEALRSDITSLNKALSNTQRANQIIATADSALGQVSSLLNDVRGLVTEAANAGALSDDEIAANQLQIDSSLEAINRIAQTTTFQGRRLLDGSLDFTTNVGSVASVKDSHIDQANLGATGSVTVDVNISTAATKASLTLDNTAFTSATSATANSSVAQKTATLNIGGETLVVVGRKDFDQIEIAVDDGSNAAASAAFSGTKLTITVDTDGSNDSTLADVQTAINGVDGFYAYAPSASTNTISAAVAAANTTATTAGIKVTAPATGSDYNNVTVKYKTGASTAAAYDASTSTLTVTVASGNVKFSAIKSAIDATGFTASYTKADGTAETNFGDQYLNLGNQTITDASTGSTGGQLLKDALVFELNGKEGSDVFNFQAGATAKQIAAAVNLVKDATGVSASNASSAITFSSTGYGSEAKVNVNILSEGSSGTAKTALSATRATGTDIVATVNGVKASGSGNALSINTATLDLSLTVADGSSTSFSFNITGGGALFQLGGDVVSNQQARLGIGSLSTGQLGGASGRLYELGSGQAKSLTSDATAAAKVVDEVINKVTTLRGRLGAFQRTTLDSNTASLTDTLSNLTEAQSTIRDADFAKESASLTRAQILVQSGTAMLQIANQQPQNVLSLLRG